MFLGPESKMEKETMQKNSERIREKDREGVRKRERKKCADDDDDDAFIFV